MTQITWALITDKVRRKYGETHTNMNEATDQELVWNYIQQVERAEQDACARVTNAGRTIQTLETARDNALEQAMRVREESVAKMEQVLLVKGLSKLEMCLIGVAVLGVFLAIIVLQGAMS